MPWVMNGCGTWYTGKQRLHTSRGVCSFCNASDNLVSYDTTNYIVVFFIPLVPLKTLRILEECSSCKQHRVLPLRDWEAEKKAAIANFQSALIEDEQSSEPIKQALIVSIQYQDPKVLSDVAEHLAKPMIHDSEVQALLGDAYSYFNKNENAVPAYRYSLKAKHQAEVSDRLVLALLRTGDTSAAVPLAQEAIASKEEGRLWVGLMMSEAFQMDNQHDQSLIWLKKTEDAFPEKTTQGFFSTVRKTAEKNAKKNKAVASAFLTNKGVRISETNVRTRRYDLLIGPAIAALLVLWYLGAAFYYGENHDVYLVNGLDHPSKFLVDDQSHLVYPGAVAKILVAEGNHTVAPDPENPEACITSSFKITTSFWSRPFSGKLWIINPDRMALLTREEMVYSENPNLDDVAEPKAFLYETFYEMEPVDYPFRSFPESLEVKKGESIRKSAIRAESSGKTEPTELLSAIFTNNGVRDLDGFIQDCRDKFPSNLDLPLLINQIPSEALTSLLKPMLATRPLQVRIHKMYQDAMGKNGNEAELMKEYQLLFSQLPGDSDAAYLLARITEDPAVSKPLWKQSVTAEKPSIAGMCGFAALLLSRGDLAKAKQAVEMATSRGPSSAELIAIHIQILSAMQDYAGVIEKTALLSGTFRIFGVQAKLLAIEAGQGRAAAESYLDALEESKHFETQFKLDELGSNTLMKTMRLSLAYACNDIGTYTKLGDDDVPDIKIVALVRHGKIDDAFQVILDRIEKKRVKNAFNLDDVAVNADTEDYQQAHASENWSHLMTLAIVSSGPDSTYQSSGYIELALSDMASGDRFLKKMIPLIESDQPCDIERFKECYLPPDQKRLIAAVLAMQNPDQRHELGALANTLNFQKVYPYWEIREFLEGY